MTRMRDYDLDLHLTRLAAWALQTLGSAVLLAVAVGVVVSALLVVFSGDTGSAWAGVLGAALAFGFRLYAAGPPMPSRYDAGTGGRTDVRRTI